MSDYSAQLAGAIDATYIHSPTGFTWFGKRSPRLLPRIERVITPGTARSFLRYTLQSRLYSHFYCPGRAIPARDDMTGNRPGGLGSFVDKLSMANSGQGYWAEGWEQIALPGLGSGLIAAGRAGLLLLASEGEYRRGDNDDFLLHFGKELPSVSPGFYMALGDFDLDDLGAGHQQGGLVRFYWHLTPEGAIELMRLCSGVLNEARIPFKLKALNDPQNYDRCDAAVLYIRQVHYRQVASLLEEIYPRLRAYMLDAVPALTKGLAPGLGLAEDPGDGDSFGLHRCGLIADGCIQAYEAGVSSSQARLQLVINRLSEAGISLGRPYLNPGSADTYNFRFDEGLKAKDPARPKPRVTHHVLSVTSVYASIAAQLTRDAMWHEGICAWLGTNLHVETQGREAGTRREEWSTLGPDLYTGTAGVGFFLAEYAALTGDSGARKTSLGAFQHAFLKADTIRAETRPGLYTGWLGIALAAARAGRLLGEAELLDRALDLARRVASEDQPRHEHDLLAGSAGAIVGCLALMSITHERFLLDYAIRLGEDLTTSARLRKRTAALSWPTVSARTAAPLTGFSHGAAGIGYSLLELWQATHDPRLSDAALGAFRYEQSWFNPLVGNWPDFRETGPMRGRGAELGAQVYVAYWCHGAPGIALSRLRASAITADPALHEEALAGIRTTERAVRSDLATSSGNYSLCHGLAGNATVLLHAAQAGEAMVGGSGLSNLDLLVQEVAEEGVRRYNANGWWACGTGGKPNAQAPGLMLGLAGIGHFYLRLAYPTVPSLLLIAPEAWTMT